MSTDTLEQQLEARDPDVRLMLQVRDDVQGAFEVLVERYQHRLVGIMVHVIGRAEEAEDLTQEVFLRVYRARKGIARARSSRPGCSRSPTTWALNHLREKGATLRPRPGTPAWGRGESGPWSTASPGRDGTASAQLRKVELSERRPRCSSTAWARTRRWPSC